MKSDKVYEGCSIEQRNSLSQALEVRHRLLAKLASRCGRDEI
jgi:hypothetical protein